mmetsp:Transcript_38530/g.41794  ORF Transcript_38530/g.41794 Transcript_38530/m.41794 type:complete len:204 (-) Transcript_38530:259-870(-)
MRITITITTPSLLQHRRCCHVVVAIAEGPSPVRCRRLCRHCQPTSLIGQNNPSENIKSPYQYGTKVEEHKMSTTIFLVHCHVLWNENDNDNNNNNNILPSTVSASSSSASLSLSSLLSPIIPTVMCNLRFHLPHCTWCYNNNNNNITLLYFTSLDIGYHFIMLCFVRRRDRSFCVTMILYYIVHQFNALLEFYSELVMVVVVV